MRRPVAGGKDLTMHNAFLAHAGLSLWLEVALGLLLAVFAAGYGRMAGQTG